MSTVVVRLIVPGAVVAVVELAEHSICLATGCVEEHPGMFVVGKTNRCEEEEEEDLDFRSHGWCEFWKTRGPSLEDEWLGVLEDEWLRSLNR